MTTNLEWKQMNDIQRGAMLFHIKCQHCHSNRKDVDLKKGPNLWGVIGRKAGTQGSKTYSKALTNSGIFWTRKTIKQYLHEPSRFVPGTKMYAGAALPTEVQSDVLVTYLESISPGWEERVKSHRRQQKEPDFSSLPGHPQVPLFGDGTD
mmetsp:Transcript_41218/g.66288  ORF Transcript_41218/g.66288 Transcript_41218/m.66288 type:complete len:150 (+) Transcript_41218:109-558(+)